MGLAFTYTVYLTWDVQDFLNGYIGVPVQFHPGLCFQLQGFCYLFASILGWGCSQGYCSNIAKCVADIEYSDFACSALQGGNLTSYSEILLFQSLM